MSSDHDKTKSQIFNKFFASVFGQNDKPPQSLETVYEELNYLRFIETAINEVLEKLPLKKASGLENLGNNIL